MKNQPLSLLFLALLLTLRSRAADPAAPEPRIAITAELVSQLVAEAKGRNPALEAAAARAEAASEAVSAVRQWEDPVVTVGLWVPGPGGFTAAEMGNLVYGVEQKLPLFGNPQARRQVAEVAAAREKLVVSDETEKLRRDLTAGLVGLALADETVALAREEVAWLDATVTAIDQRYRVGKSSQVDWLKAKTERAKATNQLATARLEVDHEQAQVNRLLNRDLASAWPAVALPAIAGAVPYDDRLVGAALDFAPRLKVMQQETAWNAANARLTGHLRKPEIGVGLAARQYTGDGEFREATMSVDFSVPWLNGKHYDADVRRDHARMRAAERDAEDYALEIRNQLHQLTTDVDAARRQAILYRDEIIPLAEQTLSSAQAAWVSNLGLFQDILDARRTLVEDREALDQAIAGQWRELADVTLLTGIADLPAFSLGSTGTH